MATLLPSNGAGSVSGTFEFEVIRFDDDRQPLDGSEALVTNGSFTAYTIPD